MKSQGIFHAVPNCGNWNFSSAVPEYRRAAARKETLFEENKACLKPRRPDTASQNGNSDSAIEIPRGWEPAPAAQGRLSELLERRLKKAGWRANFPQSVFHLSPSVPAAPETLESKRLSML